jgi:long-chain acyl-CoA synthetase
MKGYLNMPEETAMTLGNGWLYTGDVAKMDEDGYFYIVDRKKDMVVVSGYNVYPREVEEILFEHPDVAEAVAIGVADEYRGESVKGFVVKRSGASTTEEEVLAFCKERLAAYKTPKAVEFREELPKSAVGKLLRRVLVDEECAKTEAAPQS